VKKVEKVEPYQASVGEETTSKWSEPKSAVEGHCSGGAKEYVWL